MIMQLRKPKRFIAPGNVCLQSSNKNGGPVGFLRRADFYFRPRNDKADFLWSPFRRKKSLAQQRDEEFAALQLLKDSIAPIM